MEAEKTQAEIDEENKKTWLDEHLPYELMMLRHSYRTLTEDDELFFLDWNAAHASFAVSAANLAAFVTNGDKKKNNLQAWDFVNGFRSRKDNLASIFLKMEPQIFHLGKSRPTDEGKFDIKDIKKVYQWIEEQMKAFLTQLSKTKYTGLWNEGRSVPPPRPQAPPGPKLVIRGANRPTASSADPQIIQGTIVQGFTGYDKSPAGPGKKNSFSLRTTSLT